MGKIVYFSVLSSKYSKMHCSSYFHALNQVKSRNRHNYSPEVGFYFVLSEYCQVLSIADISCMDINMNL